uniref:Photosystem II reaction center protein Z n=1 Tax=Ephedra sinica TaxID=33152 RepID=A0A0U3AYM2_EPHSI|nr:PsbZ [Ephedra sinica]
MTIAFQLTMFALIAISFLLLIGVPIAFAFPEGWSGNKNILFSAVSLWIGLVISVSVLNSFI